MRDHLDDDDDAKVGLTIVLSQNGHLYQLRELSIADDDRVHAADGLVIAFDERALPFDAVFVRRNRKTFLVVTSLRPQCHGPFWMGPPPSEFRHEGYDRLTAIPSSVYVAGAEPDPDIGPNSPTVRIKGAGVVAVPAQCRLESSDFLEVFSCHGKRFARQTSLGLERERAELEAESIAERARLAAEAAEAANRHEDERLRRAAEQEQRQHQEDEERLAAQNAWLASLPPQMLPGARIVDKAETNPPLCEVRYPGVRQTGDSYIFDQNMKQLPTLRDAEISGCRYWPGHHCYHGAPRWHEFYAIYEGPGTKLGTRVPRPKVPFDQFDRFKPLFGELLVASISVIGKEYEERVDKEFSVHLAKEFLTKRAPKVSQTVSIPYEDDDADLGPDDPPPRRGSYQQKVMMDVEERYPEYHDENFEGDDWPWDSVDWIPSDKRLIVAEMLERRARNAEWEKRKQALAQIFKIMGARFIPADAFIGDDYFGAGLSVQVAVTGHDLDKLLDFLDRLNCKWDANTLAELPTPDFLEQHRIPDRLLEQVIRRWNASNGSPIIFEAMVADLIGNGNSFRWNMEGLFPAGQLGALVAPAKIGKSELAFYLAACVATGMPFCGLPVRRGKAVILYGEDTRDVFDERMTCARQKMDLSCVDLIFIHAKEYDFSIEKALADLKAKVPDVRLLFIDTSATYVPNTTDGGAARDFTTRLSAYAAETGATVIFLHHTSKDLPAAKARSSKIVIEKFKGSGEFYNAARFTLTMHLESDSRDDTVVLQTGLRVLTLHPGNNIPRTVPRLLKPLRLRKDRQTGLNDSLDLPVIGLPMGDEEDRATPGKPQKREAAAASMDDSVDADAREAAPVIARLQEARGKKLAFGGLKSLYSLKGDELVDWTRDQCIAAHRRAVELGLV